MEFRKSTRKNKKYMVYVPQIDKWVHWGDSRYQHFADSTPLKLYSHLDHYDIDRRKLYKQRHEKTRHKKYSPSWFADQYLW